MARYNRSWMLMTNYYSHDRDIIINSNRTLSRNMTFTSVDATASRIRKAVVPNHDMTLQNSTA